MKPLVARIDVPSTPGLPSAFGLLPADLETLGCPGSIPHVFGRLQRPWTWNDPRKPLGRETRAWLLANTSLQLPTIDRQLTSDDGTTRLLYRLSDTREVESVHMPRDVRSPRVSLCISSQVGCAMGCTFCATGTLGLGRNLSAGEIVGQVLRTMAVLGPSSPSKLSLVFMGMGEPLHNLKNVCQALRVLTHPTGLGIPQSRITVSTSGIVPAIEVLGTLGTARPRLALSLNGTTDAQRQSIMPVNRKWGLAVLREAVARWPFARREVVTVEYVMLAGINDSDDDAHRLAAWVRGLPHLVNLIPFNAHSHSGFQSSSADRLRQFAAALHAEGTMLSVRQNRGRDVQAACGQLVASG